MILLEDELFRPFPMGQVSFKSYLPSKKIHLFRITGQNFFQALPKTKQLCYWSSSGAILGNGMI